MTVLADLGAGADRRPGIDHGAAIDIGADIDEARHQHDARRDIGGAPHDRARHGAEAGGAETRLIPGGEFRRHLVPPMRAARPAGDLAHVVEAEGEQHRLLEPLLDLPGTAVLAGDAQLAIVERGQRRLDSVAHFALGGGGNAVARLPGSVDGGLQLADGHGDFALDVAERPAPCGSPSGVSIGIARPSRRAAISARNGVSASATWWT